jgi:hypothetical protein
MRHIGNHLPAYPHDEKVVIVKNTTKITFLWRHASDELLLQIDNLRKPGARGGTKMRAVKTVTKDFARKVWKKYLTHGYTKA